MAMNLCKFTYLRIPFKKINFADVSYVTKFSTLSVPKDQIISHNFHHIAKIRLLKNKCVFPVFCNVRNDAFNSTNILRCYSTDKIPEDKTQHIDKSTGEKSDEKAQEKPPSLLQRFKQMYRDYWYVLVPVHLVTSAFWFSSFYYIAKSGVDIASFLEAIGAGEKLVEKLRNGNSTMGYIAIAYALYKIATPVRYTVTLGGTTISIKYLKDWGYIKPIPPKDKIKTILNNRKEILLQKTPKQLTKMYQQEKKSLKEMYQKEKKAITEDKKGFYTIILPKLVRRDDKNRKRIDEN